MARDTQEPTEDEFGAEVHPAFGMIAAHRVAQSPPGQVLFDSEIRHQHYMVVTVSRATRRRDLNHDWIHSGKEVIEIGMSESQWASFVSSVNTSGVPCTLFRAQGEAFAAPVPGLDYAPRMALTMAETTGAVDKAFEEVKRALETYKEHKTVANLKTLERTIEYATPNVQYAAKTMSEHVEKTVVRAKADIEAMVTQHAQTLGLDRANFSAPLELGAGE